MKTNIDYSLYLVTDRDILKGRDLCNAIEEAILGGVTIVQLRDKAISSQEFYNIALDVKKVTDKYNIPLIINDRIDIAMAVDAAGVHLGQSDLPCTVARKLIGDNKILGISVATLEEAIKCQNDGSDYVGVGAIFPTGTKLDARYLNIESLSNIKKALSIPVLAIGGINEDNFRLLKDSGIDGICIVSAILGKGDIRKATENLKCKLYPFAK